MVVSMALGVRMAAALLALAAGAPAAWGQLTVRGRVVDENGVAVDAARVQVDNLAPVFSDLSGGFVLNLPSAGSYVVSGAKEGYFALRGHVVEITEGAPEVTLVLNHQREFVEQVDVVYSPPTIDPEQPAAQQKLTGIEVLQVPYPAAHDLRGALPMFHGVVQDSAGNVHVNGGAADQTYWTLDGFNITDPVTGAFEARVNIDSVRSLDLQTSRYTAQTGKGSAGSIDLKTAMGDDRYRFSSTNFIPSVEHQKGLVLSKWTPRATVSGPIRPGRAWFSNGFDTFYDVNIVPELPEGRDRTKAWRVNDIIRGQVNVTPRQILSGSFLINYLNAPRHGLNVLDPVETTIDRRERSYFYSAKHQVFLGRGTVAEFGFGLHRGFRRAIPQGRETFVFSPEGRHGNFFADRRIESGRDQGLVNLYFAPFEKAGQHQIRAGADLNRIHLTQYVSRTGYEVRREDRTLARAVTFTGAGEFERRNFETALYLQDNWSPWPGVVLEAGLRADWDQVVRDPLLSPRLAAAYAPAWAGGAKFSAGAGIFHDALNLRLLSQHLDQRSISSFFGRDGGLIAGPLETSFYVDEHLLRAPRYRNFSLAAERPLGGGLYGRLSYLNRRGRRGLTYLPVGGLSTALSEGHHRFSLANARNDHYDALEAAIRRTFGQFEWSAGYTWSSARSDAILDFGLEDPIFAEQAAGPLLWDAPHRFQTWGWLPVPAPAGWPGLFRKLTVAYWLEARSGFPFRVVNEEAQLVGRPNSSRFPVYFNWNLHLERRFTFLHHEWAWRFGFNNITAHANPNVVNNNIDSPEYLTFSGGQRRALTVRLRFLGKT
jgi:hypothetical protein